MASPLLSGNEVTLKIDKMAVGGYGLGRHENMVIFVPFTAPGDLVKIKLTDVKKNFAWAELKEIIEPSGSRVKPVCPHFGACGGCQWQHLSAPEQLVQKRIILQDLVNKFLPDRKLEIPEVQASPLHYYYRNRSQPRKNNSTVGYHRRKSHDVLDIKECHIIEEPLAKSWPEIKSQILADEKKEGRTEIFLTNEHVPKWKWIDDANEDLLFSQVNRFQNEDLLKAVMTLVASGPNSKFMELYAGSGNFTFPIFNEFFRSKTDEKSFVAVEKAAGLVQQAQSVMKNSKISPAKMQFLCSDVDLFVQRWGMTGYDLVLVDPPRTGLSETAVSALAHGFPTRLIYISCHPVSLCRDLQILLKAHPEYRISFIKAYEMFPQTDHFETIVELRID
ncbi:MAG: TRAM domain-containing protein [Bdellovibrionota bacterium]